MDPSRPSLHVNDSARSASARLEMETQARFEHAQRVATPIQQKMRLALLQKQAAERLELHSKHSVELYELAMKHEKEQTELAIRLALEDVEQLEEVETGDDPNSNDDNGARRHDSDDGEKENGRRQDCRGVEQPLVDLNSFDENGNDGIDGGDLSLKDDDGIGGGEVEDSELPRILAALEEAANMWNLRSQTAQMK